MYTIPHVLGAPEKSRSGTGVWGRRGWGFKRGLRKELRQRPGGGVWGEDSRRKEKQVQNPEQVCLGHSRAVRQTPTVSSVEPARGEWEMRSEQMGG